MRFRARREHLYVEAAAPWTNYVVNDKGKIHYHGNSEVLRNKIRETPVETQLWAVMLGRDFKFTFISVRAFMDLPDTRASIEAVDRIAKLWLESTATSMIDQVYGQGGICVFKGTLREVALWLNLNTAGPNDTLYSVKLGESGELVSVKEYLSDKRLEGRMPGSV